MTKPRDYQEALGQAIRERRKNLGMNVEKLARIIGKDADYVTLVEDGEANLSLHDLLLIGTVLNLRLSTLLAIVEFRLFDE